MRLTPKAANAFAWFDLSVNSPNITFIVLHEKHLINILLPRLPYIPPACSCDATACTSHNHKPVAFAKSEERRGKR